LNVIISYDTFFIKESLSTSMGDTDVRNSSMSYSVEQSGEVSSLPKLDSRGIGSGVHEGTFRLAGLLGITQLRSKLVGIR